MRILVLYSPQAGAHWNSVASQAKQITGGCLAGEGAGKFPHTSAPLKLPMTETTHKITLLVHYFFQPSACGMTLLRFDNVRFDAFARVPPFCMVKVRVEASTLKLG